MTLPVYLISLAGSTDRRARISAELDRIDIPFTHVEAVNGKQRWEELLPSIDMAAFARNTGREVMAGEIGCYHSHLQAWDRFLATDAAVALVLEDDMRLHDDFPQALQAAIAGSADWDILKLSKIRAKHPVKKGQLSNWRLNAYLGPFTGTGSYLITRDTAQRMLPRMLPITRPIDHEIDRSHIHGLRHYGLDPFPSYPDDGGESTITGTGFSDVHKFPIWQRLPNYLLRARNLLGKTIHTLRNR